MTKVIPAKSVDKVPQFNFAVFSVRNGESIAQLESSFDSQSQASNMFDRQYSKWGLTDTNFYLVDWSLQSILQTHEVF